MVEPLLPPPPDTSPSLPRDDTWEWDDLVQESKTTWRPPPIETREEE